MTQSEINLGRKVNIDGLLQSIKAAGCTLHLDGWHISVKGKPPEALLEQLKSDKLPLLFYMVANAPHQCLVCGGVASHEDEPYWFCREHFPNTEEKIEEVRRILLEREDE